MTKVNTKNNGLTVETVAQIAEKNAKIVFNVAACTAAIEEAPHSASRSGSGRDILSVVQLVFATKNYAALSMSEIKAGYFAGTGTEKSDKMAKQIYEAVFQHSDACRNKKKPSEVLFTRDAQGKYAYIKTPATSAAE